MMKRSTIQCDDAKGNDSSPLSAKSFNHSIGRVERRRPCDRCHDVKEKCRWSADNTKGCERCSRLNYRCQTDRPLVKLGRKPKLAIGNRMQLRKYHSSGCAQTDSLVLLGDSSLGLSPAQLSSMATRQYQHHVPSTITLFPELTDLEMQLLEVMLKKNIDIDKYIVGPSFRDQHQQTFSKYLKIAMPFLKDAFIACAADLAGNHDLRQLATDQHVGHKRAAAAIASLRSLDIHGICDLSLVLALGAAIVTFAGHHSGDELLLCRCILGLIKALHDADASMIRRLDSDGTSFFICLLGTETALCLFRCQVPTLTVRPNDFEGMVDRFIGVSAPMLAHFYDICSISNSIHRSNCRRDGCLGGDALKALDRIEQAVEKWQPLIPIDFIAGILTSTDVTLMLSQAKILRWSALIVMHRLRYAFGTSDDRALASSNNILHELDMAIKVTGRSMPFAETAYLVAGFEITNPAERQTTLSRSYSIVDFSSRQRDEIETWLISWWTARDKKINDPLYWDDIASVLLQT